jgi:hypothetical protein
MAVMCCIATQQGGWLVAAGHTVHPVMVQVTHQCVYGRELLGLWVPLPTLVPVTAHALVITMIKQATSQARHGRPSRLAMSHTHHGAK